MQSVQSVIHVKEIMMPISAKYAGYNIILLDGSTHTYNSVLPVKIGYAFTRVILKRRVKTESVY